MKITAKITCAGKDEWAGGETKQATLKFYPDYQDGRNGEWAASTPALNLVMTVKGSVADSFEIGKHYTLTFTPEIEEN